MRVQFARRARGGGMVFVILLAISCGKQPAQPKPAAPKRVETSPIPRPVEAPQPAPPKTEPIARDLDAIRADKTLRVLFTFNTTGYFVFRGETMGYEYELLNKFARDSKLKLEPMVVRDSATLVELLNKGEGDVIAAQLVAPANESEVLATDGLYETAAAVVQRGGGSPASGLPPQPRPRSSASNAKRGRCPSPSAPDSSPRRTSSPARACTSPGARRIAARWSS